MSVLAIWAGGLVWAALLSLLAGLAAFEWGSVCGWRRGEAGPIGAGLLYIGVAWGALLLLRAGPRGFGNLLFVMGVVWAADIGAYVAGRLVGGPRLWPALSPSKTWSGAAGGLAAGVGAGTAIADAFSGHGIAAAALVAASITLAAQAGDLLESALKRRYGRKDSGTLIPGHGGVLDRVDGLLAAAPIGYACLVAAGPGGWVWG